VKGSFTQNLINLIGYPATRKLIAAYRGQHVYFPETLEADHHLVETLGLEAAQVLCQEYSGLRLLIPMGRAFLRAERNLAIHAARAEGAKIPELVSRFDLSPRAIREILSKSPRAVVPPDLPPEAVAQLELFP
jgi:hypothetical protein